jgi:hypothetical protein
MCLSFIDQGASPIRGRFPIAFQLSRYSYYSSLCGDFQSLPDGLGKLDKVTRHDSSWKDCGELKEKRTYWLKQNSKIFVVFHNLRKLGTGPPIDRCARGEVLETWIRDEECSL